ncbi:TonB-dependent receptor [uncultured Microscilla sp.]|uniref:TonB-dependent receptor n=1 Tax=uncultured Microscilla sp. TaxID=432653 RepID=UPI002618D0A8|nr:TonB-dependent receptor [uncultured Microscilla sp.]
MMKHLRKLLFSIFVCLLSTAYAQAQVTLSGVVKDNKTGEGLVGVNIVVDGTVQGTTTKADGSFSMSVSQPTPFKLKISYIGYASQTVDITGSNSNIQVSLKESNSLIGEVVVSASRVEEKILESPVTIEKMDIIAIKNTAAPDFYDGLANLKGVHVNKGSMNFASINTRGFATISNVRMVQLMDGMDNAAPLLNFPTGNVVGISELDMESMELVPGAASALYGPNAFNGILMMNSKSPFEYQGLSVLVKGGVATSNTAKDGATAYGTQPLYNTSIRYAKSFLKDKLAFKVNFSLSQAQDWRSNDYVTHRTDVTTVRNETQPTIGDPSFDGLNSYGDEVPIVAPFGTASFANTVALGIINNPAFAATLASQFGGNTALAQGVVANGLQSLGTVPLRRLGYKEEDMLESFDARSMKISAALHYRITPKIEASFSFRRGSGSSVYQGGERYALRDFTQTYYKAEVKGANFFARAYMSETDDGDSYNMTAMGLLTTSTLAPTYIGTYASALLPTLLAGGTPTAEQVAAAQTAAYAAVQPGTSNGLAESTLKTVREGVFQRGGAGFIDNSRLYHAEFNYNFSDMIDFAEIQVGGNYRQYDLFSDGTVFNENRGNGTFERIKIGEFGVYTQVSKKLLKDRLKITASIRFDKNENFDGQITPRASLVYSAGKEREHNFRASFQTGFRNPDTQAQFIYFPSTSGILLGSTKANAEQYGLFQGGATDSKGNTVNLEFIQPEQLTAFEVGYKGLIANKVLIDINGYFNQYNNFMDQQTVFAKSAGTAPTGSWTAGTAFRPYINSKVPVNSQGLGIGVSYKLPKNFIITGNYSAALFSADIDPDDEFQIAFNTPGDRYKFGLSNRGGLVKNLGFSINYRWQDRFLWRSAFGHGYIPAYGVLDAQVNYKIKSLKSIVKLGASNIGNNDYRTSFGAPFIGQMYYLSITFDQALN